jgi:FdhD protein
MVADSDQPSGRAVDWLDVRGVQLGHPYGGDARAWGQDAGEVRAVADDPMRIRVLTVARYEKGKIGEVTDEVAAEEPLELRVDGRPLAVIMRTPGHDRFLAAGFLLSEGIIQTARDLREIGPAPDRDGFPQPNALEIRLRPELEDPGHPWQRHFTVTTSCGVCGRASIDAVLGRVPPLSERITIAAAVLLGLEERLRSSQPVFTRTGGLHAAALFDLSGRLIVAHEDVGRHNAVDKVIGQLLLQGQLPAPVSILLVSGRASFELVQKAVVARIPFLIAVGAPSSLAVELARAAGVTLVGLLRPHRFTLYAHPERLRLAP